MSEQNLIKLIHTTFNIYGLIIPKKLSAIVEKHLRNQPDLDPEIWLTRIVEQILTQNLTSPHVELEHIKNAMKESIKPASTLQDTETILNVIDIFTVPKVIYDLNKQKYVLQKIDRDLFSDAEHKSLVFKERLDLLWYRTLKHDAFAASKFGQTKKSNLDLVPIEYLLSESKTENVCIMGVLAQLTEGQYYLEDYGGSVKIDLTKAEFSSSLVMEGSIVLAKGKYVDGIMQVKNISFPPPESSESSQACFLDTNTFGGPHPTSLKFSEKLKAHELNHKSDFIIFISEFWVDSESVLDKFRIMLSGYADDPPIAIVLCGHFLSCPPNAASVKILKEGFKKLAKLISEFQLILQITTFIFVPGPYDFSAPKILPRPSLPKYLMEEFLKIVPHVYLATNPCRIQYCTKEIVVFRENIISKLCRSTLSYPSRIAGEKYKETGQEIYEAFAKSIIQQSHLTPLLFSTIPVYWKHDQALRLYPTPDTIVVADDFQPYCTEYSNHFVCNPGPFVKSDFSFQCYFPATGEFESCGLGGEKK